MVYILSIDTSENNCSVAVHADGTPIALTESLKNRSHAENVNVLIEQVLQISKLQLSDLQAIAISKGPGSYTGLRIASASAKGLCTALSIPLIAVNTLQAIAARYALKSHLICPIMDARRQEVYYGLYNELGEVKVANTAEVLTPAFLETWLATNRILFVGSGAAKCATIVAHTNASFFIRPVFASAAEVGHIAYQHFIDKQFEDIITFEPNYLKDFYTPNVLIT